MRCLMMTTQPQLPKVEIDEISLFYYSYNYYWFKIFPRFWLVKTARIIHHNQFCWTNLERIFHIEPMTKSAAGYRLLNWWRQNDVKSAARCRLLNRRPKNLRMRLCYFWMAEKQRAHFFFKSSKIFWMNSADRGARYPPRTSASMDNTFLDLQNSS